MSAEYQRHKTKTYLYDIFVRATLGRYLPDCLREVAERKPADPIEFIAQWLYKVYDSCIYFQEKRKYLRELCQVDVILQKEKKEHAEKLKPFAEEMRAERWKYYTSLTEEFEALEGYIQSADVNVDEKSKQRYQEVQNLIRQEEVHLKSMERSSKPSIASTASTKATSMSSDRSENIIIGQLPSTYTLAMAISVPDSTIERTSVVRFQSKHKSNESVERVQSGISSRRHRMSRDTQRKHTPRKNMRPHSAVDSSRIRARMRLNVRRSSPSDLTLGTRKHSDVSMKSVISNDESASVSYASQSTDSDFTLQNNYLEKCQLGKSTLLRHVLDERDSESDSCSNDQERYSSYCIDDSDVDELVAVSEYYDKCKVGTEGETRLNYQSQSYEQRRDHATSGSKVKPRIADGKMSSNAEDIRSQTARIDRRQTNDSSFSTHTTSANFAGYTKLPRLTSQSENVQQATTLGPCDEQTHIFPMKLPQVRHGAGRLMKFSSAEKDGTDYSGDIEDMEEDLETRWVQRDRLRSMPERLHLPPLRVQSDILRSSEEKSSCREERRLFERFMDSPDYAVQFPVIPPHSHISGTLVMTYGGHIAYVSRDFGVVASNSLKIRKIHPLDKPEMWEKRNFQCQSFYDHELYSQSDILGKESDDDDDDFRYKDIPRMTMEEFTGPPNRRWNQKGEKRPP